MPAPPPKSAEARTRWSVVLLGVLAGIMVAFQIGKLPAAIPTLQRELALDLVEAGWVLAVFHGLAAATGAIAGVYADRWGLRRVAFVGLLATGFGAAAGGLSDGLTLLLFSRADRRRGIDYRAGRRAGADAAGEPAGRPGPCHGHVGLLHADRHGGHDPVDAAGARARRLARLWIVNAGLVWLFAGLFWAATRTAPDPAGPGAAGPGPVARTGRCIAPHRALAAHAGHGLYAATYLPILGFLPKYLIEHHGYSQSAAAAWGRWRSGPTRPETSRAAGSAIAGRRAGC